MPVTVTATYQLMPADSTSRSPYSILTINGTQFRFDHATPEGLHLLALAKALGL